MSRLEVTAGDTFQEEIGRSKRFAIVRQLGSGGMGVVYEAIDRERDSRIALKTLRRIDPASIYRFKREFRALADVTHPNLVTLYELVSMGEHWFLTMELLDGVDLLSYVRGHVVDTSGDAHADSTASIGAVPVNSPLLDNTTPTITSALESGPRAPLRVHAPADSERIWRTLPQLTAALTALHSTGHLHRDIKPSNILVTTEDRVVVLDFGVVTELAAPGTQREGFVGTPAYAAPEQAVGGGDPTPAADWYSVGAILYEALAGRRPYAGVPADVIEQKRTSDPPPPDTFHSDLDPELVDLCMRLLDRDPSRRPTGEQVHELLRGREDERESSSAAIPALIATSTELVGRRRTLDDLRAAYELAASGTGATLHVHGRSGMGKTSLVQCFLDELRASTDALVLTGRCYERESVPYHAIDSLVDALCRHLLELPRPVADALMPLDVRYLARAFPVLRRVEAIASARRRSIEDVSEPIEVRRRAFAALRELLARLAEQRPLVLFIDDLQWGDVDSAQFLAGLMDDPSPPLLFLVSYRAEDIDGSSALEVVREAAKQLAERGAPFRDVSVGRLALADANELAAALLLAAGQTTELADKIARESRGNPFFVHEFVRFVCWRSEHGGDDSFDLSEAITARVEGLSADARRLIRTVAVAGRPMMQAAAGRAAGLGETYQRALAELRSGHLVRTTGARSYDFVETYHDRIREVVVDGLSAEELRGYHLDVARGIAASEHPDPESLALHYAAGGASVAAFEYAVVAADAAANALAFGRASAMYRLALELAAPEDDAVRGDLGRKLGDALVNAGRGADAAYAYLEATQHADAQGALELRVRAGGELMRSGRLQEGEDVLRPALASAGVALSSGDRRTLLSLIWGRIRVRTRGLSFRERALAEIPRNEITKIDAFAAATTALGMADSIRGAELGTRLMLAALRAGDPLRIGRALSYECVYASLPGPANRRRSRKLIAQYAELAERLGDPMLAAFGQGVEAFEHYQNGEWKACRDYAQRGEQLARERCRGAIWEQSSLQVWLIWALSWLGDFNELGRLTRQFVTEARERGDLYAEVSLSTGVACMHGLAADAPAQTARSVEAVFSRWPSTGFHLQHYWAEYGLALCELYVGKANEARARMAALEPKMRKVYLHRVSMVAAEMSYLRARCATAIALQSGDAAHERQAATAVKRLAKQRLRWCGPSAELLAVSLALASGRDDGAVERLAAAEVAFAGLDMPAFAAAAARGRATSMGGDDGAALAEQADATLRSLGVRNPERMVEFIAPGVQRGRG